MTITDEIERLKRDARHHVEAEREVRSRIVELQAMTAVVRPYNNCVDGWHPTFAIIDGNGDELALTDDEQFATIAAEAWNAAHEGNEK